MQKKGRGEKKKKEKNTLFDRQERDLPRRCSIKLDPWRDPIIGKFGIDELGWSYVKCLRSARVARLVCWRERRVGRAFGDLHSCLFVWTWWFDDHRRRVVASCSESASTLTLCKLLTPQRRPTSVGRPTRLVSPSHSLDSTSLRSHAARKHQNCPSNHIHRYVKKKR